MHQSRADFQVYAAFAINPKMSIKMGLVFKKWQSALMLFY